MICKATRAYNLKLSKVDLKSGIDIRPASLTAPQCATNRQSNLMS